ncbi:hypothetical protein ACWD4T_50775, partial [Streptomyces umbrinus]
MRPETRGDLPAAREVSLIGSPLQLFRISRSSCASRIARVCVPGMPGRSTVRPNAIGMLSVRVSCCSVEFALVRFREGAGPVLANLAVVGGGP